MIGPGLVTGASDDDPSGIATYSQAGAAYGLSTLWTSIDGFYSTNVCKNWVSYVAGLNRNIEKALPKTCFVFDVAI